VAWSRVNRLEVLAQVVPKVCDSVVGVAKELCLGLRAVVFLSLDVRENARNLTIWASQKMAMNLTELGKNKDPPPSSLAITSALPSYMNDMSV
jgi:hypothetical protein